MYRDVLYEIKERLEEGQDIIAILEDIDDEVDMGRYGRGFVRHWHEFLVELGMCIPMERIIYSDIRLKSFRYKGEKYVCLEPFSQLSDEQIGWILSLIEDMI